MIKSVFDRLPKRASPFFKPDLSRYDKSASHDIESCETDRAAILKYEIAWDISRGFPVWSKFDGSKSREGRVQIFIVF